jgi:hypothetical protein
MGTMKTIYTFRIREIHRYKIYMYCSMGTMKKYATESTMQDKVIPDKRNYCKNEKKNSIYMQDEYCL